VLQGRQLGVDELGVRGGILTGLPRAPPAGHDEDERQEQDHPADAHPPPGLPLAGGGGEGALDGQAVRLYERQVIRRERLVGPQGLGVRQVGDRGGRGHVQVQNHLALTVLLTFPFLLAATRFMTHSGAWHPIRSISLPPDVSRWANSS